MEMELGPQLKLIHEMKVLRELGDFEIFFLLLGGRNGLKAF